MKDFVHLWDSQGICLFQHSENWSDQEIDRACSEQVPEWKNSD